jgi:hypothetical protein
METTLTVAAIFTGIFTFAFGMAWLMPLAVTSVEQRKKQPARSDTLLAVLDLVLMITEFIPVFWLFRAIPAAPSTYRAVRTKWAAEKSIRFFFYAFLACAVATVALFFLQCRR